MAAGVVPAHVVLPGGLEVRQRVVRITLERVRHIAERHPQWLVFCLTHMARVLAAPEYLGYRATTYPNRVEFVRRVGRESRPLLVAVKFLAGGSEAWVSTAHPLAEPHLTRRLRASTMQRVDGEP